MNNSITFDELKEKIEVADKLKDIEKIDNDINEGLNALKSTEEIKQKYIEKIQLDYTLYVYAINFAMNLRNQNFGFGSTRKIKNYDEEISQHIKMLRIVKTGKIIEEILKVINGEKNQFEGGIISE